MSDFPELAQRVIRCRHWKWVEGMVIDSERTSYALRLPDLSHPATVGCLFAIYREVMPNSIVTDFAQGVAMIQPPDSRAYFGSSLAEVLVMALEALD